MKQKNNKSKIIKIAIIVCLILILVLLLLLAILKNRIKTEEEITESISEEQREEKVTDYVRVLEEKERMQIYLSEFIKHIEEEEYSLAYKKLYPEFKNNFFQTEQKFKTYAKANYTSLISIEYEDIQKQGNYYILTVKIINLEGTQMEETQKYIIQENGLNDYYISFQVRF